MKRIISTVLFLFFLKLGTFAQLTSLKVYYPEYLKVVSGAPSGKPKGQSWQDWCLNKIQKGQFGNPTNKIAWAAYSDRDNNVTFTSPASNARKDMLSLGEKIYIAEIQQNMAHVFSTKDVPYFPNIPSDAIDKGWININHLLLWQECPRNNHQIYQKGLVVQDVSKTINNDSHFLTSPGSNSKSTGILARSLDILFVMKTEIVSNKKYYLLCKEFRVENPYMLLGWLSEDYLTEWNQRLCLEPTSSNAAVNYYKSQKLYPITFYDSLASVNFYTRRVIGKKFAFYDLTTTYLDSYNMRLPILRTIASNDDIYYSAVIEQSIDNGARKKKIEELKELLHNVNIIFVIDHTSSMKGYFSVVSKAVQDLIRRDYNPESTIRVGVVLYKDYADTKTVNVCELNSDLSVVAKFLNDAEDNAYSSDRDYEEAMFEGLRTALDTEKMGYQKKHSNFIILLGDAGDHSSHNGIRWQDAADDIAQKMNDNNINFLGYQVNNDGSNAGTAWGLQVARIQKLFSQYFNNKAKTDYKYCATDNNWWELRRDNTTKQYIRLATYKFVDKGTKLSQNGLKTLVSNNIDNFISDVEERIRSIDQGLIDYALTTKNVKITEDDLRAMYRLLGWSEDEINRHLRNERTDKFLAYVPSKIGGTDYRLFDYVLFFSQDELDRIYRELNKINIPNPISQKAAFMDAVTAMGVSILGEDASTIGKMDMNELLGRIYGVPVKIETAFKIDEIIYMKNEDLERYMEEFNEKLSKLKSIKDKSSKYRFESNDKKYYWYPFREVPGFVAK